MGMAARKAYVGIAAVSCAFVIDLDCARVRHYAAPDHTRDRAPRRRKASWLSRAFAYYSTNQPAEGDRLLRRDGCYNSIRHQRRA